ncbi:MAG: class II aldolase/adducin family protein [Dehalococcoidia bacterium]|nr:class II aldolase/adducin family protein [Dehalococcoidia bacterium]
MADLKTLREEVIEASRQIVSSGIMTKSLHGNLSLKLPSGDAFLLTAGGSLADMQPENIALFALDGTLIEGTVMPVGAEIVQMHAIVYRTRPEFGGVVHTHSPFATGFAVAGKEIPGAYEAMVRNGMVEGVPVAGYGPRGSQQSVENIEAVLRAHEAIKALLLENHGVLTFAESVGAAVRANQVVEESAEIILYANNLGGAKPIPSEMITATRERAASFSAAGAYSSETPSQA